MDDLHVSVIPELSVPGECLSLQGVLDAASFNVGGQEFAAPEGINYDIQLSNTGEAVLLTGTAQVDAVTQCARCLEPATLNIQGDVQGYFFIHPQDEVEEMEPDEYGFVNDEGKVDAGTQVIAALVHEAPFVVLCSPDCKGLCPSCGANLNEGPCSCDDDDVDPTNPFAALKGLKFD